MVGIYVERALDFYRRWIGQPGSLVFLRLDRNSIGQTFPWGTLVINVTGSFVIGLFATVTGPEGRWLARDSFKQFFMYGVCGGYTTFSSFSYQTLTLAEEGEWFKAGANCVLSLVLCLVGVWLGHILALEINSMKVH